ncbi:MAG: CRTAC1 family protein [Candidatus Latescibacteria bacterium]|nr:CRTAC1 family protein [Candidatus Latescibacterota bacterium]
MSAVAHIKQYKTGLFYTDEFRGENSWNGYEHNVLLRNEGLKPDGSMQFSDVAMAVGADDIKDSRGIATADFDNDGDLDMAISTNPGDLTRAARITPILLRNDVGDRRSWLAVELKGTESNRDGIGAVVTIKTGEETQLAHVVSGAAYASQQSLRLYFGLDDASQVDQLSVRWPSGIEDKFEAIPGSQLVRITEGGEMEQMSLPSAGSQTMMSAR